MTTEQDTLLRSLAAKYIWWKTPEKAMAYPERLAAQIMNLGDYNDVLELVSAFDTSFLVSVLTNAEAGQFNARSWNYWHLKLGVAELGAIPPLPPRKLG